MELRTFFDNFEVMAEAPNGVEELRKLILEIAVQGKVVPQSEEEGDAEVLLQQITQWRNSRPVPNAGNLRQLPDVQPDEVDFLLPKQWCWSRIGNVIGGILGGGTPSKNNSSFWDGSIPWASVKDLKNNKFLSATIDAITESGLEKSSSNLIPAGNVIVCTRMGLGKIVINTIDVAINQDLKALFLPEQMLKEYFYLFYKTLEISGTGMTVSGIRQDALLNIPIPVPPPRRTKTHRRQSRSAYGSL